MRVIPFITLASSLTVFLNLGCGREEPSKAPAPAAPAKAAEPLAAAGKETATPSAGPVATPEAIKTPAVPPQVKSSKAPDKPAVAAPVAPAEKPAVAEKPAPPPPAPAPPAEIKPPAPATPATPATPAMPGKVVYPASMGKVTFPHADHAKRLACDKCHTTKPPQKIPITKALAHQLCISCHQEKAAGPVKCLLCHIK